MGGRREWEDLLKVNGWSSEYESVNNLLRHLRRKSGSEGSRATYLKTLAQFVRFTGLSPDELVSLGKGDVERLVQDFCDSARAPRTANRRMEELKTFFMCNGFRVGGKCSLSLERRYVSVRERSRPEYIPSDEEIYRILNEAGLNLKWRAFFLALYTTGLRNSTLRALRYGDIREEFEAGIVPLLIRVYPEMKMIVPEACKGKIPYFVFMPSEAVEALKAYLSDRERKLGPLNDDQILFCSDDRRVPKDRRPYTPLDMSAPERVLKRAARAVGIKEWRCITPHSLRKAFERSIRNSGLDTKDQEFFMGHILPGSQDTYYDKTKIEEMRRKYARIEFFPSKKALTEDLRKKQILDMVRLLGFPEEKIKRVEEALAKYRTVDEAMDEIRKLGLGKYKVRENPSMDPKKIIDEGELEKYLAEGWDVQTVLPSGRILIRKSA
ncbi:MAG: tyrosine-type recombinase/integrase [Candidatus Bathyarchaeia archaeon]